MIVEASDELERLRVENAKLNKIRTALMSRVERGMDQPSNAFGLFELAISLDKTVRSRTAELQAALANVERANQELTRAKAQADQASSFKSTFLAFVSHDLLQPLNAAKLSLSGLTEAEASPEQTLLVKQVELALTSLEDLIRTLLDISKLDAGVMRPEVTTFRLETVLAPLRRDLEPAAVLRQLKLRVRECDAYVNSDPVMLRRILQNLVNNAVRYTHSGGVLVGCRRRGDRLRIEVVDTGPGIEADRREAILEEFRRGAAGGADFGGFGLGLAIVRRLSQALDLKIDLRSRLGRGSTFAISVPMGSPPSPSREGGTRHAAPLSYGVSGARVLIVENDPPVAEAMKGLLDRWGCEAVSAGTCAEALAAVDAEANFDLIVADMHLDKGENGVDVIDAVRSALGFPIPGFIVTADHSETTEAVVAARGYELLRKPIKPAELRSLMAHLLA
jgi:signal transduction histidine kinase